MHRLHALLFVAALLWQPFSALLPAGLHARAAQIGHAVVHGQEIGHHHHEHDATLQLEVDEPDHQHVLDGLQFPALAAHTAGFDPRLPSSGIEAASPLLPPSADPQRLLRPPRPLQS